MYICYTAITEKKKWRRRIPRQVGRQVDVFYHIYIKQLWQEMEQSGITGCLGEMEIGNQREKPGENFHCTFLNQKNLFTIFFKYHLSKNKIFRILERFSFSVQLSLYEVNSRVGGSYILQEAWEAKESILERMKQTKRRHIESWEENTIWLSVIWLQSFPRLAASLSLVSLKHSYCCKKPPLFQANLRCFLIVVSKSLFQQVFVNAC